MPIRTLYRIIWILSAAAIVVMTVYFAQQPTSVPTAEAMVPFSSQDRTINLLRPKNWQPDESSSNGVETDVQFIPKAGMRIVIRTALSDSLAADTARMPGGEMPDMPGLPSSGPHLSPLEAVHEIQRKRLEKHADIYMELTEQPTTHMQIAGVEGLATRFQYKARVGIAIREMSGKRISALAGDRGLSIIETCPRGTEDSMKQIYDQMLASLVVKEPGSQ